MTERLCSTQFDAPECASSLPLNSTTLPASEPGAFSDALLFLAFTISVQVTVAIVLLRIAPDFLARLGDRIFTLINFVGLGGLLPKVEEEDDQMLEPPSGGPPLKGLKSAVPPPASPSSTARIEEEKSGSEEDPERLEPPPNREEALEHLISSLERDLTVANQATARERSIRARVEVDLKESRRRVSTLEKGKETADREMEKLSRRNKELLSTAKSKAADLDRQLKAERATTKQLRSKLESAKRETKKLEQGVRAGLAAQKDLASTRTDLAALKKELASVKKEAASTKKKLEKKLDSVSASRDKLKTKLDSSKREAKQLKAKQSKKQTIPTDTPEAIALREEIEEMRTTVSKRDADALQYQQALSQIRGCLRKAVEKNEALESRLKLEIGEVNMLRVELAEANRMSNSGHITEAAVLRAKVTELRRRSKRDSSEIRELKYHLWAAEERLASTLSRDQPNYTAFGPASVAKNRASLKHATPSSAKTVRYNPWVIPPWNNSSTSSRAVPKSEEHVLPSQKVAEVKAFLAGKTEQRKEESSTSVSPLLRSLVEATANPPLDDNLSIPSRDSNSHRLSWMSISSSLTSASSSKRTSSEVSNLEEIKALFSARDPPASLSLEPIGS